MRLMLKSLPYAAYLAGGAAMAVVGPTFWGVSPAVAAIAAFATTGVFSAGHAAAQMIRRLNVQAQNYARQSASIESLQQ